MTYLDRITQLLIAGLGQLPDGLRTRHRGFLGSAQNDDGGFSGREGASDLYYTGFALRGLAICGGLTGETAARAADFLKGMTAQSAPIIDLLSLIYGAELLKTAASVDPLRDAGPKWREAVAATLESYRRDDGGYAKTPKSASSSTYYTFLVAICYELLGESVSDAERVATFLRSRRRDEGGFVEISAVPRAATNPTAAAVSLLKMLDALDSEVHQGASQFLAGMQTDEGGFRANTRIPIADLLSTFTALITLADLDALGTIDISAAERYASSLEQNNGGFRAAAWDTAADAEYTFYGLGTLALVSSAAE